MMPFYYDINRPSTTNASSATENQELWVKTGAVYDAAIKAIYASARFNTAGGGTFRAKFNTGTTASGGSAQTPSPRNLRGPAATTVWANAGTSITPGATLTTRAIAGFAQTGGQGGWVAVEAADALYMGGNALTPVDAEFTSIANGSSVPFEVQIEFSEGGG
jgi:hypothetical protein